MEKVKSIRPLLPNTLTMMALAFGVSSINMALWGKWELAVIFIVLSGFIILYFPGVLTFLS